MEFSLRIKFNFKSNPSLIRRSLVLRLLQSFFAELIETASLFRDRREVITGGSSTFSSFEEESDFEMASKAFYP